MKWHRDRYSWHIRGQEIPLGAQTLIAGCLDLVTAGDPPRVDPEATLKAATDLQEQGSGLLAIASRPPGAPVALSPNEQLRLLVPALRKLRLNVDIPISLETESAEVAERAIELGVHVIQDPSGLSADPALAQVVSRRDAGLILGYPRTERGAPGTAPTDGILNALDSGVNRALRAGLDRRRIVIDPGLGHGKPGRSKLEVLAGLDRLAALRLPVAARPLSEDLLPEARRGPDQEWAFADASLLAVAILGGVHVVQIRRVAAMQRAVSLMDELHEISSAAGDRARNPSAGPAGRTKR